MKVMFLIPHMADGGAERILSELSMHLGVGETILVLFEEKVAYSYQGKLISLNMPIDRQSILRRVVGFVRRIARFRRILQRERPDAVISFMGEANAINALLSRRPILTVHTHLSSISKFRGGIERLAVGILLRILYRRASIVAVSEGVKRDLVETFHLPAGQINVITNAIDSREIQEKAAESAECPWKADVPVVITAGRLHPRKDQSHLLRAF